MCWRFDRRRWNGYTGGVRTRQRVTEGTNAGAPPVLEYRLPAGQVRRMDDQRRAHPTGAMSGEDMKSRCDICGKGTAFGHNVSHSNHRTNRRWMANIQHATFVINGYRRKVQACTRCIRTERKRGAVS